MSGASTPVDPLNDASIAATLFTQNPLGFGGMVLRGSSPERDALVTAIADKHPTRRLPAHVDDERLLGGIDIAASLAAGRPVETRGLLTEADGTVLIVPMAERMDEALAGRLAQALDDKRVALILLDDAREADEGPPPSLMERLAFQCDLTHSREREASLGPAQRGEAAPLNDEALGAIAATGAALGVHSVRALIHASEAARAHAAMAGRDEVERADLEAAARLVLAPRAKQLPPPPQEPEADDAPPPEPGEDPQENNQQSTDQKLEDKVVEAAAAAIPADLLAQLAKGLAPRAPGASGSGQKRKSGLRGKPLGARPGMPRGGARLAMIDTLRAAVPWQGVRQREVGAESDAPLIMRKDDLRVRRFEEKAARVTIFAVDASGSAAAARLAEAKGAVELMLAQAYVTRSEVALIAFRGEVAELLLPPTRSLTRARRALAELPGGGGTPLAMGLNTARELAHSVRGRGRTPSLIVLTDGRANIGADGQPGRRQAGEDAKNAAKAIARERLDALVVDISARASREGGELAEAMQARYLALPRADAKTLHTAICGIEPA
ncbi:magnesium chelatase subunit D [Erythrobacter sp. SCSIO 43205]|uniref:magnesium chelatase subunit D n=1 Tax=Erythrobacter sp. SCSIO 43205 TaxID=2779361 RepID=UPI001CA8C7EC|nr:magnesium chelatase subunit D [Erythrobacter sp. SCSIO 43205]UAB77994.1 magnesium chelatase subunit D [Erythrobacter sp. SCSIO 43205]